MGRMIVQVEGREGILRGSICRGGGVQGESKAAYGVRIVQENRLFDGILSYYKGNCGPASPRVETSKSGRGSEEERIRIPVQVKLYIVVNIV
jgi:hypothetical protein